MRARRGVSITELMVIMSACVVCLTLTGSLLHRAMRIQMESRSRVDAERNALRLSEQFRADVHRASAATPSTWESDGDVFLRLEMSAGGTAEYSRSAGTILRTVSGAGDQVSREEFAFPTIHELTIESLSVPQRLVMAIVTRPVDPPNPDGKSFPKLTQVPLGLHVEAVVGRDLRFAAAQASQEVQE